MIICKTDAIDANQTNQPTKWVLFTLNRALATVQRTKQPINVQFSNVTTHFSMSTTSLSITTLHTAAAAALSLLLVACLSSFYCCTTPPDVWQISCQPRLFFQHNTTSCLISHVLNGIYVPYHMIAAAKISRSSITNC